MGEDKCQQCLPLSCSVGMPASNACLLVLHVWEDMGMGVRIDVP